MKEPFTFGPADYSHERSTNSAGYLLLRFANDRGLPFDGNFGIRVVKIVNRSEGNIVQGAVVLPPPTGSTSSSTTLFPSEYFARSGGRATSRGLPALNVRFKPTDTFFIRAAYTVTLDEPSFYDLRANGSNGATVSSATATTGGVVTAYASTSGNPTLRPVISHNTDLSFEWYPTSSTTAHLSLFYKTLNDTIVYGNTLKPVPFETSSGTFVTEYASVSDDFNAAQAATVKGVGARWPHLSSISCLLRSTGSAWISTIRTSTTITPAISTWISAGVLHNQRAARRIGLVE